MVDFKGKLCGNQRPAEKRMRKGLCLTLPGCPEEEAGRVKKNPKK
jgi:hypothetical protein